MQFGYPASVLTCDRDRGLWSLDHDFDAATMSWQIASGDGVAELRDALGVVLARGVVTADVPLLLEKPGGGTLRLDRIEIEGVLCLYLPTEPLEPGLDYPEARALPHAGRAAGPEEIAHLSALGTGTMIATDLGPQPIDWMRPGDRVLTRDNGYQPLLWLGQHTMPRRAPPETRPLCLAADCFGEALPERDILVTPATGILLAGHELELWFGESEMLARARHAAPGAVPGSGRQQLYSLLFEAPEVILAEGMWVASVQANSAYLALLPERVRMALSPRLARPHREAVRGWLADWEVAMFRRERIAHSRRIAA